MAKRGTQLPKTYARLPRERVERAEKDARRGRPDTEARGTASHVPPAPTKRPGER
jgi:hypothetical protein